MTPDTIAAIATPLGGGIGIIRISGEQAEQIARRMFRASPVTQSQGEPWASHRLYYGHIIDPVSRRPIDEALVTLMRAPHSYTRENVVEIQCHGGFAVLNRILELILRSGSRLAEPGEFTRRAFLNGRIDLSQAEAVADLISARSQQALESAGLQLNGYLREEVRSWIDRLNACLAEMQAEIEFGAEIGQACEVAGFCQTIETGVLTPIASLLEDFERGSVWREGVRLSIAGRPNVGKSSLLNRLLRQEKAIVSSIAGTTRDPVEQSCRIDGIPITLVDTAGIRVSPDPLEHLGVSKAREAIRAADIVLLVVEASDPLNEGDQLALRAAAGRKMIVVVNKIDLVERPMPPLEASLPDPAAAVVAVSALNGTGIGELKKAIVELCNASDNTSELFVIPSLRQKAALERAQSALQRACAGLRNACGEELVVCDLSEGVEALQMITGEGADTDLLDQIFSRFCIGK